MKISKTTTTTNKQKIKEKKQFVNCGNPTLFSTFEFLSLVLFKIAASYVALAVVSL